MRISIINNLEKSFRQPGIASSLHCAYALALSAWLLSWQVQYRAGYFVAFRRLHDGVYVLQEPN